ncbi:tyrosine-type recombinase/integrase [Vreelandella alkaliphila]|uniref:tyrosine-type recombinase/integrase n=1 Tax=Vreelandella alkaliphila TaxID=272774 RepID=UPI003FD6FCE7
MLRDEDSQKKNRSNVIELEAAHPTSVLPDPVVSVKQQRQRLKIITEYLCFVVETALRKRPHFAYYLDSADNLKKLLLKQKPKRQGAISSQSDPDKKAPPPEVFDEVMRLADPECHYNPFTSLVRNRNYLMFQVLYETGMRAGEILQLKVEDIEFTDQIISVVRRHDDPGDKWRSIEPNAKTEERELPISFELSQALYNYIFNERRLLAEKLNHGFVFVSNKGPSIGTPMSLSQFSKMVLKVAKNESLATYIEGEGIKIDKHVTRHGFRHNFNKRLSEAIDQYNKKAINENRLNDVISEKAEIDTRKYLLGHRSDKSGQVYNLRHTKEIAEKLHMKAIEEVSEKLKAMRKQVPGMDGTKL